MIALLMAAALTQSVGVETWTCFVEPLRPEYEPYQTTFIVTGPRVVSTGTIPQGFIVLQDNAKALVFASSNFGVDDYTGEMIDQMATVIAINKSNSTMRRTFLQKSGSELEHVEGDCVKVSV